jgi:urea transport system substrate-binding protein
MIIASSSKLHLLRVPSIACLLVCGVWVAASTGAKPAEPIKIGAVLPFSGGVELYGQQAKLGLDFAACRDHLRGR